MSAQSSFKKHFQKTSVAITSAALACVFFAAPVAAAPKTLKVPFTQQLVTQNAELEVLNCDNSGPTISFGGNQIILGGLASQIRLKNNVKGTKQLTTTGEFTVSLEAPSDTPIFFYKQGSLPNGVGGNPYIGFAPSTSATEPTDTFGRCVQGLKGNPKDFSQDLPGMLELTVAGLECSANKTGLGLGIGLNQDGSSTGGRVFATQNSQKQGTFDNVSAVVGNVGNRAKSSSTGRSGAGGNPFIEVQFGQLSPRNGANCSTHPENCDFNPLKNTSGQVVDPVPLGRCRDLM
jgi:hypothetical protein